jgi:hypothetical protein
MIKSWTTWAAAVALALGVSMVTSAEDPLATGVTPPTTHRSHKKSHRQGHASASAHHKAQSHHRSTHAAANAHAKPAPAAVQ